MMKDNKVSSVGGRIREARYAVNMSQKSLAEKTGVSSNYIALIERGKKKPSQGLVEAIANATGTTMDWINGTSVYQTAYPEISPDIEQIEGNAASVGYLVELLRQESSKKGWDYSEPTTASEKIPIMDWEPDYAMYFTDGPIRRWAFDLTTCIYKRPCLISDTGDVDPQMGFALFIMNALFSRPYRTKTQKYTFVVPTTELFDTLLSKYGENIPVANISIMQIDIKGKRVVREEYLCKIDNKDKYLEEILRF